MTERQISFFREKSECIIFKVWLRYVLQTSQLSYQKWNQINCPVPRQRTREKVYRKLQLKSGHLEVSFSEGIINYFSVLISGKSSYTFICLCPCFSVFLFYTGCDNVNNSIRNKYRSPPLCANKATVNILIKINLFSLVSFFLYSCDSVSLAIIFVIYSHCHLFSMCSLSRGKSCWRGDQTSPTVVSLKVRLPRKLQRNPLFLEKLFRYTVCFVMVL